MGKADVQIVRELQHHGGPMVRLRSVSEAEFIDKAAAAVGLPDSTQATHT